MINFIMPGEEPQNKIVLPKVKKKAPVVTPVFSKSEETEGEREVFTPFEHQDEAFGFIEKLDCWALFMEQGTGKSKVVLMKAKQLVDEDKINRLLVICPSALKNQWKGEVLKDHCPMPYVAMDWDGFETKTKQRQFREMLGSKKFKVLAINYEAFLPESKALLYVRAFLEGNQALVICDESTKIKNPAAKRTEKILSGFRNRPYKGILTGTPTPNSPFDLWAQFSFLHQDYFHMKYFHFKKHYCIMIKKTNEQTGRPFDVPIDEKTWKRCKSQLDKELALNQELTVLIFERIAYDCGLASLKDVMEINIQATYTPFKNLEELRSKINPITFRIRKEDCLDLPDKVYEKLEVAMTAEQKRAIKELKKDMFTQYSGKELSVKSIVSLTGRLQMITGGVFPYHEVTVDEDGVHEQKTKYTYMKNNPKIKALLDDLETVEDSKQILIWANFVSELELIYSKLKEAKYDVRLFYGATSKSDRLILEDEFKAGKFRIMVMNPSIGDMGFNFQNCTMHYFYSNSTKADSRLQAEDRSHRIGQTNKVTYKDIQCLRSIDQKIYATIRRKEDIINFFRNKTVEQILEEF